MKKDKLNKKKARLEWYKWLIIIGIILGVKSVIGLSVALFGVSAWIYKKRKKGELTTIGIAVLVFILGTAVLAMFS